MGNLWIGVYLAKGVEIHAVRNAGLSVMQNYEIDGQ